MTTTATTTNESIATPTAPAAGKGAVRRWQLILVAVIALVYGLTANWTGPYKVDGLTNVLHAHAIAEGSPIIDSAEELADEKYRKKLVWIVASEQGPTSQYPPGVALWGSIFYLPYSDASFEPVLWTSHEGVVGYKDVRVPSFAPATMAAVVSVALAMAFLMLTLTPLLDRRSTQVAVLVAAFGTGAWSVAADKLWQHGPTMMWISLGTYLSSRNKWLGAGLAFGAASLTRPHTAVIAAALGLTISVSRRTWRPALLIGIGTAVGLALLFTYNYWLWGELTVSGGYGDVFARRSRETSPVKLVYRIGEFFVHQRVGILLTSPVVLVGLLGLRKVGRKGAPDWAWGAAIGAVCYTLIQLQANRATGGSGFFGYRYALEPLMAAAPVLAIAGVAWVRDSESRLLAFKALAGFSVVFHAYGAVNVFY